MKAAVTIFLISSVWGEVPVFNGKLMSTDQRIEVYREWAASDPKNISNQTLLAAAYIQKTRETTDFSYIDRASQIVDRVLSEKRDYEALRLRNLIELNRHHFAKVAQYASEMTESSPSDPQNWGTLGDALMEMGEHEKAFAAYQKMVSIRSNLFSLNRMANYRFVTGDADGAISMMSDAIAAGSKFPENAAWCLVELGNMYFKTGKLSEAEAAYRKALETFPSSHAAIAGLAGVQAAQGKAQQAIETYKRAQAITPMVQYAAALYDLYSKAGNQTEAKNQAAMIDLVAKLEQAANQKANRTLALIYANQGRNLKQALELAEADFEVRKDVYTRDALGWALFKNGRLEEAQEASRQALKLNTPDPQFREHAAAIARSNELTQSTRP